MKPSQQKPNRLDRLELIMADQDALGMNEDVEAAVAPDLARANNGHSAHSRNQARHLLHYLPNETRTSNGNSRRLGR